MTTKQVLTVGIIGLFLAFYGCITTYQIQVIDGLPKEVYLTYTKGAVVNVGDMFRLYEIHQPAPSSASQGHGGHGGGGQPMMKHEKAMVQVLRIVDEVHAAVKVVSGEVIDGLEVEKLK